MGYGRIVVAQSFFGLLEMATDDVGEPGGVDDMVGVEGVEIVDRHHAGGHVELVLAGVVVGLLDVFGRDVVFAEDLVVEDWVFVVDAGVWEETQGLMVADGEGDFGGDIGLVELGGPPAVVCFHEGVGGIVEKAGEDNFFGHAGGKGFVGALQNVSGGVEAELVEIEQGWLGGHCGEFGDVVGFACDAVAEGRGCADGEKRADAFAEGAGLDLVFEFSNGRSVLRDAQLCGHCGVELLREIIFECFGAGFGVHELDCRCASECCDHFATIDFHLVLRITNRAKLRAK